MISNQARKEIDIWVAKYPEGKKSSAVMQALTIVQKENGGNLTNELILAVADYLEMPATKANARGCSCCFSPM